MTSGWHQPLLLIDGLRRESREGWTYPSYNPATGELLAAIPDAGAVDVAAAVSAAHLAFHGTAWNLDAGLRRVCLRQLHEALSDAAEPMKALLVAESGMPATVADAHYDQAVARLDPWGTTPKVEPAVTAVITPMTSPLQLAIDAVGAAVRTGSTIVLKPSPDAAWAALELGRLAADALPRGVLNVVTTRDIDRVTELTRHPRIDAVDFTGSAVVGARVEDVARRAGKRLRLDTGGIAPLRLLDDAHLQGHVVRAALAMATYAGQGARLPAVLHVPIGRYDEAVAVAARVMREVPVGDPADPETVCGPVRSLVHRARVQRYLALAESEGAQFEAGGSAIDRPGWWIEPTVVSAVEASSRLAREEILGPVLVVVPDGPSLRRRPFLS